MRALCSICLVAGVLAGGCAARRPETQAYFAGRPVDLQELSAQEVARAVRITPRARDIVFQAPLIQTSKIIDLHRQGQELGIALGDVERTRYGYLSGVRDRTTGAMTHYVLFESNFVVGENRYAGVTLADGTALQFHVSRTEDPCIPNCLPVIEALIVVVPDPVLRANAAAGLPMHIALTTGDAIDFKGLPAYVQGYLQAVDA
jgi:hypothetical protein